MPITCSSNESKVMCKLKDAIISELAASNPSMPISPDVIDLRLQHLFPSFHAPTHPPYSLMIQEAILKLNEEGGSSEEAISGFLEKEYEGLPWGHASFLSHHLKKLCRNGEVVCVNDELYVLAVVGGDSGNEEEEMSRGLNIENRDGKGDQTLGGGKGREAEPIDGWSRVNGDQGEECENQCEVKRQNVEVKEQNKACEPRREGFEVQREGGQELIKEVRQESQNFREQIEVVEAADEAKGKPAEVAQKRRGRKRKKPQKTEQQIEVLKDDLPQPMMEEGKKYVEEENQQIKGGAGVMTSTVVLIGEHEQPQGGKMISKQGHPQHEKIDIRTKMLGFPCDGEDRENSKTSLQECSMLLLQEEKDLTEKEEEKKEALERDGQQQRELHDGKRDLIIVCALPAQQHPKLRAHYFQKARKFHKDSISASHESMESGEILLKDLMLSSCRRHAKLQVTTSKKFTRSNQKPAKLYTRRERQKSWPKVKTSLGMSKDLEELEEMQGQLVRRSEREHQKNQIKVYVRRNVSKSLLTEPEASNISPTN
ncbi:hypothetical protein PTKIN_Ptkin17bG0111200 [Pterospermum kingtungense]